VITGVMAFWYFGFSVLVCGVLVLGTWYLVLGI